MGVYSYIARLPECFFAQAAKRCKEPQNRSCNCYPKWRNTAMWHTFATHSLSLLTSTHNNVNPFAPQHHQLSYSLAECSVNNVPLPFISHLGTFYQLCSFRRKKIKNIQETYLRRTVQLIKGYKHMYTLKHNAHPKISGTSKSQMWNFKTRICCSSVNFIW